MKPTLYIGIGLLAAGAIAWMIYEGTKPNDFVPMTGNFAQDDDKLYRIMRDDLTAWLPERSPNYGGPTYYGGWFDDEVRAEYEKGNHIAGQPSKAAAFVIVATRHYPQKKRRYDQLLKNLKTKYK